MKPPVIDLDMGTFLGDPYPVYAKLRAEAPVAFVPQLDGVVFTKLEDISTLEKQVDIFSSHQPAGLMNRLMGHNLMRKDGDAHMAERRAIFPTVSPRTVADRWKAGFQADADAILDDLAPRGTCDLVKDYATRLSGEALRRMTGLTAASFANIDRWSQAMIDGIANYTGNAGIEAKCHEATAEMDAAIKARAVEIDVENDLSLIGAQIRAGLPMESIQANVKLAISGGQNEPRDAIAGAAWALLSHPDQLRLIVEGRATWADAVAEYVRWISPIGMSPRRVARDATVLGYDIKAEQKAFFMFGAANRDPAIFADPDTFDITRDASRHIAFGAGPHFCAGAWASKALIGEVALPTLFTRLADMRLTGETAFTGWAFRGPTTVNVAW
ncbi:MAG: cytochrome P450 [Pikeienuella sp.]